MGQRRSLFTILTALAVLRCATQAQQLSHSGSILTYRIGDAGFEVIDAHNDTNSSNTDSQLFYHLDHTFIREDQSPAPVFLGEVWSNASFGTLSAYARAQLVDAKNAHPGNRASITSSFFDPLTITGGSAGDTIEAIEVIEGDFFANIPHGQWGRGGRVEFYEFSGGGELPQDRSGWTYVADQTLDYDMSSASSIHDTVTARLTNYDPTKRYALYVELSIDATALQSDDLSYQSADVIADFQHSATLTQIGFRSDEVNSWGTFTGASGTLYPTAVPEPASMAVIAGGLALLVRRKSRKSAK